MYKTNNPKIEINTWNINYILKKFRWSFFTSFDAGWYKFNKNKGINKAPKSIRNSLSICDDNGEGSILLVGFPSNNTSCPIILLKLNNTKQTTVRVVLYKDHMPSYMMLRTEWGYVIWKSDCP